MYNLFFGRRQKYQLNNAESTYKVHYLGNVMTSLVKGCYHHGKVNSTTPSNELPIESKFLNIADKVSDGDVLVDNNLNKKFNSPVCNVDKPVRILWENHLKHNGHAGLKMRLTLTHGGLKVITKDHGLTEYYGHRIHYIQAHPLHPKLFIWVYQHVGKNLKSEIRCHAVLCERARDAQIVERLLTMRIQRTFMEYKREKRRQQNSRLCNSKNGGILAGQIGTKKRTFTKSTKNYKPPVQHGMCSAPKLSDVLEEEEEFFEESAIEIEETVNEQKNAWETLEKSLDDILLEETEEENFNDLKHECDEISEEYEENEELENSSNEEFSYEKILEAVHNNDSQFFQKFDRSSTDIKLPLSSSTSSSSIASSESNGALFGPSKENDLNENSDQEEKINEKELAPITPIFISSCSASSSLASTTSEPTISPCSMNSDSSINHTEPYIQQQGNLASDSGVCTSISSTSVINTDAKFKKVLTQTNDSAFNEVSYEFLGDLSKSVTQQDPITNSRFITKTSSYSRSFNTKVGSRNNKQQAEKNDSSSFYNPFLRSSISKSFSAFTSRLKHQQLVSNGNSDPQPDEIKAKSLITEKINEASKEPIIKILSDKGMAPPPPLHSASKSFIKCYDHTKSTKTSYINSNASNIKATNRNSNQNPRACLKQYLESPLSSPELSTCSESSCSIKSVEQTTNESDAAQLIITL